MDYASKKQKKMEDATCIASLPQEIILKILTILPPKSALSFRCTSKFFHSFIPQPHFSFKILFSFSSTTHPLNLFTVGYTTQESHGRLQPSTLQCSADELQRFEPLIGSNFADDKLCLFNRHGETTILELSTTQYIPLPQSESRWAEMFSGAALGFAPVSKTYKVFKSELCHDHPMLKVLTLGVDESWRAVATQNSFLPRKPIASVQIGAIIYLINFRINGRNEQEIAVFDIETENLIRVIPFPDIFQHLGTYFSSWVKLNGGLAYVYVDAVKGKTRRIFVSTLETSMGPEWDTHEIPLTLEAAKIISGAQSVNITVNSIGEIVFLTRVGNMLPSILIYACGTQVWRKFEICGLTGYLSFEDFKSIIVHVIQEKVYFSE